MRRSTLAFASIVWGWLGLPTPTRPRRLMIDVDKVEDFTLHHTMKQLREHARSHSEKINETVRM